MKIRLWRGFHSDELREEIRSAWEKNELLVLCPPYMETFEFVEHLPKGDVSFIGDWGALALPATFQKSAGPEYLVSPVLGVFTSGTVSGRPRLVLYSKDNVNASIDAIFELFDPRRVSTVFCYAQPFHTFGLLLGYVMSMKFGLKLITPDGKYTQAAHDKRLALHDPNLITLGTPAHFFDLIEIMKRRGLEIAPSYSCIMGGASVSVGLWSDVQTQLKIEAPSIGYGCSEAAPGITHLAPGVRPTEDGEIGLPLRNLNCRFEADSVQIEGASLCIAIVDAKGVTFSKTREIRDSLRKRADGKFVYEGRSDLTMNRGGEKFSLELLERTALAQVGVEVLAIPVADRRLGEDLALMIKLTPSMTGGATGATESDAPSQLQSKGVLIEKLQEVFLRNHRLKLNLDNLVFVDEFPRNASFKPSRQEARQMIENQVKFPVATSSLSEWLPHRAPMVWIDEVCSANEEGGEARVRINPSALYMTDGVLRSSAVIEFIAQSFGFVSVCHKLNSPSVNHAKISKAFLVGVRTADFSKVAAKTDWKKDDSLLVRVGNFKTIGPMQILDGTVVHESSGEVLASANLKLYSE